MGIEAANAARQDSWPSVSDYPELRRSDTKATAALLQYVRTLGIGDHALLARAFRAHWDDPDRRQELVAAWALPKTRWNRWLNTYWPIGQHLADEPSERFREGFAEGLRLGDRLGVPRVAAETVSRVHDAWRTLASRQEPFLSLEVDDDGLAAAMAVASAAVCLTSDAEESGLAPFLEALGPDVMRVITSVEEAS